MENAVALSREPKEEIVAKLLRARAAARSLKAHLPGGIKHGAKMGTQAVLTTVGGVAAGALSVKMPTVTIPGLGAQPTDLIVGSVLIAIATFDLAEGYDEQLNAIGSGLVAAGAARKTAEMMLARR